MRAPSLFISHGAPDLLITPCPAQTFLSELGPSLKRAKAIIMVSAHHMSSDIEITSGARPETIHDFWGFNPKLYDIFYHASGDPILAQAIKTALSEHDISAQLNPHRGLDHGAWVPLKLIFPMADIPIVQVSLNKHQDANWHFELGKILKSFREQNIMIIGSGSLTHNLQAYALNQSNIESPVPNWVSGFNDWISEKISEGDTAAVTTALSIAPYAMENHPTSEHFLPLIVAIGAGETPNARRLHHSYTHGVLSMDAYRF